MPQYLSCAPDGDESWIFYANCLHFAAKFNSRALHLLLTHFKDKKQFIQMSHENGVKSPLHVAASKPNTYATM